MSWLVLACLLPGVAGVGIFFIVEYEGTRAQQERDTLQTARALVQAVDSHLLKVQAVAQSLAASDALAQQDFARFHEQARKVVVSAQLATNVVLRDANGRMLLNTAVKYGTPLPAEAARDKIAGVLATGKPAISDIFIGRILKRPIMSIDVPVIHEGKVAYALGVGILPDHFNAFIASQHMPPGWVVAVFNGNGTIVGRSLAPEKFIGKKVPPTLLESIVKSFEGSLEMQTLEGIPVMAFYHRSPATGWGVSIGIPRQLFWETLVRTLLILAAGIGAMFVISFVLARYVGGKIAHSIEMLLAPAAALGKGEPVRVPPVQVKEAREVAAAIGRAGHLLHERAAIIRAKEAELAEAHRLARFGTWHHDLVTNLVKTSESLREIFGREVELFPGERGALLPPPAWDRLQASLQEVIRSGESHELEALAHHAEGDDIWLHVKCEAIQDAYGVVIALRGTMLDITERKRAEERLRNSEEKMRNAALHDALTGLPNRALVFEYCSHVLAAAQRNHSQGALLFIDLDRFKPINDLYGHETGDRVLKEVARRLLECTRQEDLVGRLGGDEFVIILPHLDSRPRHAATVAEHVVEVISQPFRIDAMDLSISPSIGISCFPEHATEAGALLHAADLAMYQVKQSGRAGYQFYTDALDQRAERALLVELRLRNALRQHSLRLHYQPIIDIVSNRLVGAEALLRLEDQDGEAVGPDQFIPIAESAGLIGDLGEWVAAEACRQHAAWLEQGLALTIAINVSPLQFRQRRFAERLSNIIASSGMDPSQLEIEVTESTVMENVDEAVKILNEIKSLGVKIALDDFGTGYSSLSSLSSLPLDKLKVDQSFVRRVERDQASRAVTEAIITLGRNLQLEVHGEGIESEDALRYLQQHGCNQAQGYWFSRPLPADEFGRWTRMHRESGLAA